MVVKWWNSLDQELVVHAPIYSVNVFKGRLDKLRQTTVGFSWTDALSSRHHGPRDDWLSCEATRGKMQGKK